jgi:type I restriction enzyme M protein
MNLNQYATGTDQPGLSVMNLNRIEIAILTLKEQEKIVAEIEKIERGISDLKKQIELIPKKKEQVLKKYLE